MSELIKERNRRQTVELAWVCSPPGGGPKVEACVLTDRLVLCFWDCEELSQRLEEELQQLGLSLSVIMRGPCIHERSQESKS